jgi:hypothetical protein
MFDSMSVPENQTTTHPLCRTQAAPEATSLPPPSPLPALLHRYRCRWPLPWWRRVRLPKGARGARDLWRWRRWSGWSD